MLGAIVGDIIGSRFEFSRHKSPEFELFTPDCRFTDDSVLTLATASALLDLSPFSNAFHDFYRRYPQAGYGRNFINWAMAESDSPYNSYGNGSAMRVAPVAWVANSISEVLALAEESALPTHNHPEGIKGAQAVALGIFLARKGEGKEEIRRQLEQAFSYDLQRSVAGIRAGYQFEVSCQVSVPEALCCFFESHDFESAVRLAVSLGGDADTQAAIAGSLAEAFYAGVPSVILKDALTFLDPFQLNLCRRFSQRFMGSLALSCIS